MTPAVINSSLNSGIIILYTVIVQFRTAVLLTTEKYDPCLGFYSSQQTTQQGNQNKQTQNVLRPTAHTHCMCVFTVNNNGVCGRRVLWRVADHLSALRRLGIVGGGV